MADKRIDEFPTLEELQEDDLVLVDSRGETYNTKISTLLNTNGNPIELPKNLQKIEVVHSDDEFNLLLYQLINNIQEMSPLEIIFAYDATDTQGVPEGSGLMIIDAGDGDIENAILIPIMSSDSPFTQDKDIMLSKCNEFVEDYKNSRWKEMYFNNFSNQFTTYVDGLNNQLTLSERKTTHVIFDLDCDINLLTVEVNGNGLQMRDILEKYINESERTLLHFDIQIGENLCLVQITDDNGYKITKTISGVVDGISMIKFRTNIHGNVNLSNAYGRGI